MNTYGKTKCPECGAENLMYRPLDIIKKLPVWDKVKCWQCGKEYKHTEVLEKEECKKLQFKTLAP